MTADEIEANKEWFNRDEEVVPGEPGKPPSAGGGAPPAGGGAAAPPAAPETPPAAPAETTEGGETAGAGQL